MLEFICKEQYANMRLDKYLTIVTGKTRNYIQNNLAKLLVNEKEAKLSYKLELGDKVSIEFKVVTKLEVKPKDLHLDIVYEDSYLAVINKPKGLVVHPSNGHIDDTLVSGLMYQIKDLSQINGVIRPGIIHRLDKDTSGLMVIAKNDEAHLFLANQLKDHTMYREYHAITIGVINEDKGKIVAPIGRDKENRLKMAVVADGKEAVTHFEVLERFKHNTYLRCVLETGRTHQIRVHMSYIGKPILSDPLYGPKRAYDNLGQYLHAKKITFIHPKTHECLEFEVDLPDYFNDTLNKLREE